jgi:hypothetical protein
MTITARFASVCARCGNRIEVGSKIEWERGQKAVHSELCKPVAEVERPRIDVENQGVYVMPDGSIVKVKANREKTRTYAMRWSVINGQRLNENDDRVHGEYVFEPGLVQQVAVEGRKMTLAEAKAFTLRFGICCRCGRHLKDATSVERALGPVCVKYFSFTPNVEQQEIEQGVVNSESREFNARWIEMKNEHARREAEQERRAFLDGDN